MFIKAPPQASSKHDASFHFDPANPVITNLGEYQPLFPKHSDFSLFSNPQQNSTDVNF